MLPQALGGRLGTGPVWFGLDWELHMADLIEINGKTIRLVKDDVTDLEVEAFVYYAQEDLVLGAGWGGAIAVRGGPEVQKELNELAPIGMTEAVVSGAGNMKAGYIVHAVGPKFQEPETASKLRATMVNTLKAADAKGIKQIAFPPMGAGFYGIPLDVCAEITMTAAMEYLQGETEIEEVVFCLMDNREYKPFQERLAAPSVAESRLSIDS